MKYLGLLTLVGCTVSFAFQDKQDDPWRLLKKGFDKAAKEQYEEAVEAWMKDSGFTASEAATLKQALENVEAAIGKPSDAQMIKTVDISERLKLVYCLMYCEKAVCHFRFDVYKNPKGIWVMTGYKMNISREDILPDALAVGLFKK